MRVVALLDTDKDKPQITCSFDPELDHRDEQELKLIAEERLMAAHTRIKYRLDQIKSKKQESGRRGHILHPDIYEGILKVLDQANYPLSVQQIIGVLSLSFPESPSYNTVRRYLSLQIANEEVVVEANGGRYNYRRA